MSFSPERITTYETPEIPGRFPPIPVETPYDSATPVRPTAFAIPADRRLAPKQPTDTAASTPNSREDKPVTDSEHLGAAAMHPQVVRMSAEEPTDRASGVAKPDARVTPSDAEPPAARDSSYPPIKPPGGGPPTPSAEQPDENENSEEGHGQSAPDATPGAGHTGPSTEANDAQTTGVPEKRSLGLPDVSRYNPDGAAAKYAGSLEKVYADDALELAAAANHPRAYAFQGSAIGDEAHNTSIPMPQHIEIFYGRQRANKILQTTDTLGKTVSELHSSEPRSLGEVVARCRTILDATAQQARNVADIAKARLSFPDLANRQGVGRVLLRRALDGLERQDKPLGLVPYLLSYVPRFAHAGHGLPDVTNTVPPDYLPRLQEQWNSYTSPKTNFLGKPDDLTAGRIPLHAAMEVADHVRSDGHRDAAYAIRADVMLNTLQSEQDRYDGQEFPEAPFFEYIFASAITGELTSAKQHHFDYAAVIVEHMNETWTRINEEAAAGTPGPGTAFMNRLEQYYDDGGLVPYLARSLYRHAAGDTSGSLAATVRSYQSLGLPRVDRLVQVLNDLPYSAIITNQEAQQLSEHLPPAAADASQPASALEAASELCGEADVYSFKAVVSTEGRDAAVIVDTDVDASSQKVRAGVLYKSPGSARALPVALDLRTGAVEVDTIDTTPLDPTVAARYKAAIKQALLDEVERNKAAATAVVEPRLIQLSHRSVVVDSDAPSAQQPTSPKVKTRGEADPALAVEEEASAATEAASAVRSEVEGLDAAKITQMLRSQRLNDITAEDVITRIQRKVHNANEDGVAFGRLLNIAHFPQSEHVHLRQINWVAGGGHRQIRLLFNFIGEGKWKLCGIFLKQGASEQLTYLKNLVAKLAKEKTQAQSSAATGQKAPTRPAGKRRRR